MIIASQKRKENIAEYLLYMWQIEDIIRANDLDIEKIERNVIDRYTLTPELRKQMVEWYESLIDMMRREEVTEKGHLQMNKNVLGQLVALHQTLLKDPRFAEYTAEFYRTLPFIVELRAKAGAERVGEIETCFNALYAMLMLRLQHKEISKETLTAMQQITKFISVLATDFHLDEADKLFKHDDEEENSGC
jgi:flagellin-specific chaperone FliS